MDLFCVLERLNILILKSTVFSQPAFLFEPPKKIKNMYYRCDVKFHIDNILEMYEEEITYGLCLISGDVLEIYNVLMSGSSIDLKCIYKKDIRLMNKHNKGGQSSVRFGRLADQNRDDNANMIAELIVGSFMYDNHTKCKIKQLIIGGPSIMKYDVCNTSIFKQHLSKYLFKIINTNGILKTTANEVIRSVIDEIKLEDIKCIDEKISLLVSTNHEMLLFGQDECLTHVAINNIVTIYVNKYVLTDDIKSLVDLAKNDYGVEIIITESSVLKSFGDWIGIKKYMSE